MKPSQKYCGIAEVLRANPELTVKDRLELSSQQARLAKGLSKAGGKRGQNRLMPARKTGPHHSRIRLSGRAFRDSKIICHNDCSYGSCGWRSILMTQNMKFLILAVRSMFARELGGDVARLGNIEPKANRTYNFRWDRTSSIARRNTRCDWGA